jgi:hypothetical protein
MTETTIGWAPQPGTEPTAIVDDHVRVDAWAPDEAAQTALDEARGLKAVVDAADYEYAVGLVKTLRGATKAAQDYYRPFKQAIARLKDKVLARERTDPAEHLNEADRLDRLCRKWHAEQAAKEAAAKEAAERAAREAAERERAEMVARMERAAASVPDPAVQQAIKQEAQQMQAAPLATPRAAFTSSIPAVRGYVPAVTTYGAEVDDLMALVKAVAEGKAPLRYLAANTAELSRDAKASKEAFSVPGVKLVKDTGSRVGGR